MLAATLRESLTIKLWIVRQIVEDRPGMPSVVGRVTIGAALPPRCGRYTQQPDCPHYQATAQRHATQIAALGIDHIILDMTVRYHLRTSRVAADNFGPWLWLSCSAHLQCIRCFITVI